MAVVLSARAEPARGVHTRATGIGMEGTRWFVTGANLPWISQRCDFGCGADGGALKTARKLEARIAILGQRGVRVVRWHMFAGAAPQLGLSATGMPTALDPDVDDDLAAALRMARAANVRLMPVIFANPQQLPPAWYADPSARAQVEVVLRPLFRRFGSHPSLFAWDLMEMPERALDAGTADLASMQALSTLLATSARKDGAARATISARTINDMWHWKDAGLSFHAAHWYSSGSVCASCTPVAALRATQGLTRPVVITGTDVTRTARGASQLGALYDNGYAGVFGWSIRAKSRPDNAALRPKIAYESLVRLTYSRERVGPVQRPLNPCQGPVPTGLRCPDLIMRQPYDLFLDPKRRTHLRAANRIDNIGDGPVEFRGVRTGKLTMRASQRIYRSDGSARTMPPRATLYFKKIPRQGRYWKFFHAARFELRRLDSTGEPTTLVRYGPKFVYCFRDLQRTLPRLSASPRGRRYPGCNRNPDVQRARVGTSVGWSDIYPAKYHEQWISVKGLKGCFAFIHRVDPANRVYELDENNNEAVRIIKLPFTGSNAGCPGAKKSAAPDRYDYEY